MNNLDWQQDAIKLDKTGVMSRREIAKTLGISKSTVSDFLRKYEEFIVMPEGGGAVSQQTKKSVKRYDNRRILFISDMHIPYHHEGTINFLKMLKARYNPTRIICLGDELDKHALSFHTSDPDLRSAGDELLVSLPVIAELHDLFPVMDLLSSNHGSLVWRKAKEHGIPRHYIKSYNDVLGVGEGWVWHDDIILDLEDGQKVYVHHGKSSDAIKTSQAMGMSHVCGHYHNSFGVKYWANPQGLYWAMNAGCLINDSSLAFAYNNVNLHRPIIGTCMLIDGVPILEAMPL